MPGVRHYSKELGPIMTLENTMPITPELLEGWWYRHNRRSDNIRALVSTLHRNTMAKAIAQAVEFATVKQHFEVHDDYILAKHHASGVLHESLTLPIGKQVAVSRRLLGPSVDLTRWSSDHRKLITTSELQSKGLLTQTRQIIDDGRTLVITIDFRPYKGITKYKPITIQQIFRRKGLGGVHFNTLPSKLALGDTKALLLDKERSASAPAVTRHHTLPSRRSASAFVSSRIDLAHLKLPIAGVAAEYRDDTPPSAARPTGSRDLEKERELTPLPATPSPRRTRFDLQAVFLDAVWSWSFALIATIATSILMFLLHLVHSTIAVEYSES